MIKPKKVKEKQSAERSHKAICLKRYVLVPRRQPPISASVCSHKYHDAHLPQRYSTRQWLFTKYFLEPMLSITGTISFFILTMSVKSALLADEDLGTNEAVAGSRQATMGC